MSSLFTTATIISVTNGEKIKISRNEEIEEINSIPKMLEDCQFQRTFNIDKSDDSYKAQPQAPNFSSGEMGPSRNIIHKKDYKNCLTC